MAHELKLKDSHTKNTVHFYYTDYASALTGAVLSRVERGEKPQVTERRPPRSASYGEKPSLAEAVKKHKTRCVLNLCHSTCSAGLHVLLFCCCYMLQSCLLNTYWNFLL